MATYRPSKSVGAMARCTPLKWRSPLAELKHAASEAELLTKEERKANAAKLRAIADSIVLREMK